GSAPLLGCWVTRWATRWAVDSGYSWACSGSGAGARRATGWVGGGGARQVGDSLGGRQRVQLGVQRLGRGDRQVTELVGGLGAGLDGACAGDAEYPDGLDDAAAGLGGGGGFA